MLRCVKFIVICCTSLVIAGCGSESEPEVEMHSDWEEALDDAQSAASEVYSKPLVPLKFTTASDQHLVVDAPEGMKYADIAFEELVYESVFSCKLLVETRDLGEVKAKITAQEKYKKTITDEPGRLVVLLDSYGDDEYQYWVHKTIGDVQYTFTNEDRGWTPGTEKELAWALKIVDSIRADAETGTSDLESEVPAGDS